MNEPPVSRTIWVRAALWTGVALAAALVLVLVAHAPFVRSAALGYALDAVQRNYGIAVQAERLDYNLATLRVGLAGVRLSAEGAEDEPFLEADYVSVLFPAGVLAGNVAFTDINVGNARLFIHIRPDGRSNLPTSEDSPGNDPPALRIDRISVTRLAIDVRDEQRDLALQVPALGFELTPDEGSIALAQPADLRVGTRSIRISRLSGQAAFDGRALHLMDTEMRTDDASMTIDGTVLLIARESRVDLTADGTADIARLARWGMDAGELPQGQMTFRLTAAGPIGDPQAALDLASDRVAWRSMVATDLSARARVNGANADIEALDFHYASGEVSATASIPFDAGAHGTLKATWSGVDAALATRASMPDARVLPAATTSGGLDLRGVLGDISTWSGTTRLQLAPRANARGRVAIAGNLVVTLRDGRWRIEGQPRVAGVAPTSITATGPLEGATIDGNVKLGDTDIPALVAALGITGLADMPPGVIDAGMLEGAVVFTGDAANPPIRARARITGLRGPRLAIDSLDATASGLPVSRGLEFALLAPSAVIADQPLRDVRAMGSLNGSAVVVTDLSARQPDGAGFVTGRGTYDIESGMYTAVLGGTDWQLMPTTDRPLAGNLNLQFEGSGTSAAPRGAGSLTVRNAAWQEIALGTVDASVTLDGQTASIDARAPEFDATATGRVELDAPYSAAVSLNAGELDLARVLRDVNTPTPVAGTAGLVVQFDGPLDAWRTGAASIRVTSLDATAGNLPLRLAIPARLRFERERVFVDSMEIDAGETRLSAAGDLDAFEPSRASAGVLLTLTGDVGEVARAAAATGLTDVPIQGGTGPVALLARISGSLESPVVAADLELGPGSVTLQDLPPISALVLKAHAENGWFELREGAAAYQDAAITVTGRAPMSWVIPSAGAAPGEAVLHARATNLTPAILAPFLDSTTTQELEGSVDATLDATSATADLTAITGELRLDRLDLRIADLPVTQRVPTRIVARDGFARIEAWDWVGQGTTLNLTGQVRLEDRQAAILANGLVDLRMLTPFVREAGMTTAGRLEPRLSITGPLDDPRVDGDLTLTAGELRLADPRVVATGLTMRSVVNRTSARITSLTGTVNGGMLTGTGGVDYSADQGLDVRLSTMIDGMALELPEGLRSEVDADLNLAMKVLPDPSGLLTGTITVVRGSYREPLAVVTGLLAGMRAQTLTAGTAATSSPLLEALVLDVALLTDEDIIVNNNYGRFQLATRSRSTPF
jgi:translocation and assembly module TamB